MIQKRLSAIAPTNRGDELAPLHALPNGTVSLPDFELNEDTLPAFNQEAVRHLLIGDYGTIIDTINRLALLDYRERIAWSEPLSTGRGGEYISVMTRRRTLP